MGYPWKIDDKYRQTSVQTSTHFQQWNKADKAEKRGMVQEEIKREAEAARISRTVELGKQGAWTRWELPQRRIAWSDLWKVDQFRVAFLLRSVYDTLPSPANLYQ